MADIKKTVRLFFNSSLGKTKNEHAEQIKKKLKKKGISPSCFNPPFNYYHYW